MGQVKVQEPDNWAFSKTFICCKEKRISEQIKKNIKEQILKQDSQISKTTGSFQIV